MKTTIERGTRQEYQEIIEFGDMVFGIDFKKLLPKLYDNHEELAECHFLVKEDGALCAMAGSFPLFFRVGEHTLHARGIGTVSVHPEHRGKGYMQDAVNAALFAAKEENADFLCLGGNRQRYEYFGFGKAAAQYRLMLTRTNQKHAAGKKTDGQSLTVCFLSERMEYLDACRELHLAQQVSSCRSGAGFFEITSSWNCEIYVILDNGEFLGYACIDEKNQRVHEFCLKEDSRGADAAFALLDASQKEHLEFRLEIYQKGLMKCLTRVCEYASMNEGSLVNVLNYPRVLTAYLALKACSQELMDGELVLDVQERGRYLVSVYKNNVTVTESKQAYDISLSHVEMMYYLFSPLSDCFHTTALEKSWFPAPFALPEQDMT